MCINSSACLVLRFEVRGASQGLVDAVRTELIKGVEYIAASRAEYSAKVGLA